MSIAATPLEEHLARFGMRSFRPGQREVIDAVLAGHDCLCIMPTGGGKSLCFQLPAIMRNGVTLVVSPLIALMKDQVDGLCQKGLRAAFLNSSLPPDQQQVRMQQLEAGALDLLYVAPERFRSQRFVEILRRVGVQLLAVDEAHCISEWGHDFRHDYTRLGRYRRQIGHPQTIALTATATPDVQQDVVAQLGLRSPRVFVAGFARANLHYEVRHVRSRTEQDHELCQLIRTTPGAGIVYASTRKACKAIADVIQPFTDRRVGIYHGGLLPEERKQVQEAFMGGAVSIVAATNAFGMGIDKPDVRLVVHYNLPGSLEAYYQEAGRAGRDALPSRCLLLFNNQDRYIQEFFINSAYPDPEVVEQVYEYLRAQDEDPIEITQLELRERLGLAISNEGIGTCERLLEKCGVLQRLEPHRNMAVVRISSDLDTLLDVVPPKAQLRRKVLAKVEAMVGEMRHENVYVPVQRLAGELEIPLASATRALRELAQLSAFDYVPPFRGRAIHLSRRDLPFAELNIDFDTLQQRKQADFAKLDEVVRYARSRQCRQRIVLVYFGDPAAAACGHCDNCDGRAASHEPAVETNPRDPESLRHGTRIALSGVARARGRFGKQVIAGMLAGSRSAKITKWNLQQLSTFGLLRHLTQSDIGELLDALVNANLVEQNEVDRFRPVLAITEAGRAVMKGTSGLPAALTVSASLAEKLRCFYAVAAAPRTAADESVPSDPRSDTSPSPAGRQERAPHAPVTSVSGDRPEAQVAGLTAAPPHGVAAADELSPTAASSSPVGGGGKTITGDEPNACERPAYYWTWRLFHAGFSVDECAAIRRYDLETITRHLQQAVDDDECDPAS